MMLYQRTTSNDVFNHLTRSRLNFTFPPEGVDGCLSASPSRENLLKFPHLAAIQHNNCMYLAHHLLTLGHLFKAHLPQQHSEGVATFVDMVPGFRKLGKAGY